MQSFEPETKSPSAEEQKELEQVLECIRTLRRDGGWGLIEMTFKGGDVDEIVTSIRRKPKLESKAG
jgi:hypothetical protein